MNYLAINGVSIPYPKRGVKVTVTTVVDAGRNADGVVVGQRIGRDQYKIDTCEWAYLSAAEWQQILQLISGFYFNLTFYDPVSNGLKTIRAYCGDRSAEPYWVDGNGKPTHYINCKCNFIDTGE